VQAVQLPCSRQDCYRLTLQFRWWLRTLYGLQLPHIQVGVKYMHQHNEAYADGQPRHASITKIKIHEEKRL